MDVIHIKITIEELKINKGENDIKIITDKDTILINRDSTEILKMDWEETYTSILVKKKDLWIAVIKKTKFIRKKK